MSNLGSELFKGGLRLALLAATVIGGPAVGLGLLVTTAAVCSSLPDDKDKRAEEPKPAT